MSRYLRFWQSFVNSLQDNPSAQEKVPDLIRRGGNALELIVRPDFRRMLRLAESSLVLIKTVAVVLLGIDAVHGQVGCNQ